MSGLSNCVVASVQLTDKLEGMTVRFSFIGEIETSKFIMSFSLGPS